MNAKIVFYDEFFKVHKEKHIETMRDWKEMRLFITHYLTKIDSLEKQAVKGYVSPWKGKVGRKPKEIETAEVQKNSVYDNQAQAEGQPL